MDISDVGERHIKTPVRAITINRDDNVALLLSSVRAGEAIMVNGTQIQVALEDMPAGYRIAAYHVSVGDPLVTGNQVIGIAAREIKPGEIIHKHNLQAA